MTSRPSCSRRSQRGFRLVVPRGSDTDRKMFPAAGGPRSRSRVQAGSSKARQVGWPSPAWVAPAAGSELGALVCVPALRVRLTLIT
jgi:hypothetical protein